MKNKSWLIAGLAILTVFTMVACGGSSSDPGSSTGVTVTFRLNYTGAPAPTAFTLEADEILGDTKLAAVQSLEAHERTGYEFQGWSTQTTGSTVTITRTSSWAVNTTYYAQWEQEVQPGQDITITYNLNGFQGATKPADKTEKSGEAIGTDAIPTLTSTNPLYEFHGWSDSSTATADDVFDGTESFTTNKTFYAIFTLQAAQGDPITITYNLNGFPGTKPNDYTATSGVAIGADALPALSAQDYTWLGWATTENGTVLAATAIFNSNQTFYARFTHDVQQGDPITITYDLNGFPGTKPGDFTATSDEEIGTTALAALTTDVPGFTWLGWATTADGAVLEATATFTSNQTFYARYTYVAPTIDLTSIDSTYNSITLSWEWETDVPDSYKLYGAQAASEPSDDSAYVELYAGNNLTYTHSGLTVGDVWWYKVSGVYGAQEGPKSEAVNYTVTAPNWKAKFIVTLEGSSATLEAGEKIWLGEREDNWEDYQMVLENGTYTAIVPDRASLTTPSRAPESFPASLTSLKYTIFVTQNAATLSNQNTVTGSAYSYPAFAATQTFEYDISMGTEVEIPVTVTKWFRPVDDPEELLTHRLMQGTGSNNWSIVSSTALLGASGGWTHGGFAATINADANQWLDSHDSTNPTAADYGPGPFPGYTMYWKSHKNDVYYVANNATAWFKNENVPASSLAIGQDVTFTAWVCRLTADVSNVTLIIGNQIFSIGDGEDDDIPLDSLPLDRSWHLITFTTKLKDGDINTADNKITVGLEFTVSTATTKFAIQSFSFLPRKEGESGVQ